MCEKLKVAERAGSKHLCEERRGPSGVVSGNRGGGRGKG